MWKKRTVKTPVKRGTVDPKRLEDVLLAIRTEIGAGFGLGKAASLRRIVSHPAVTLVGAGRPTRSRVQPSSNAESRKRAGPAPLAQASTAVKKK